MRLSALVTFLVLGFSLVSQAEVIQRGNLRVFFKGDLIPNALPRHGVRSVAVTIGGRVKTTDGSEPPQLRHIEIDVNRNGHINYTGLPTCRIDQIQPATNVNALRACRQARVGEGRFFANVAIPGQAPFPARGQLIAFNGIESGHHVIFAHVYGRNPIPTSYTLPLRIGHSKGIFGTTLSADLPRVTGKAGFITGIELTLHRNYRYHGRMQGFVVAGCPLPKGLTLAPFKLARASFGFGSRTLTEVLSRSCRALD